MGKIRIVNQAKNDPKNERYTNKIRFRWTNQRQLRKSTCRLTSFLLHTIECRPTITECWQYNLCQCRRPHVDSSLPVCPHPCWSNLSMVDACPLTSKPPWKREFFPVSKIMSRQPLRLTRKLKFLLKASRFSGVACPIINVRI
jgi:hypothetical protein